MCVFGLKIFIFSPIIVISGKSNRFSTFEAVENLKLHPKTPFLLVEHMLFGGNIRVCYFCGEAGLKTRINFFQWGFVRYLAVGHLTPFQGRLWSF